MSLLNEVMAQVLSADKKIAVAAKQIYNIEQMILRDGYDMEASTMELIEALLINIRTDLEGQNGE